MTRLHGTVVRYRLGPDQDDRPGKGCRCRRCRDVATKSVKVYRLAVQTGRYRSMVDAQPVREHVVGLRAAGLPSTTIAILAGIDVSILHRLLYGQPAKGDAPSKRMRPENADALLAVRADHIAADGYVLAVGSQRRLQALAWAGWPNSYIGPRVALHRDYMSRLMCGKAGLRVTAETARRIRAVFAELWNADPVAAGVAPGKSSQVRTVSARKGWVSALAWDDIDDPAAVPDLGERIPRDVALFEDSAELVAQGYTVEQAAERLGVKAGYLRKIRSETQRRLAGVAS